MRSTENLVAYVVSHPEAKVLLYTLSEAQEPVGYEDARRRIGQAPQAFQRLTRRLAQFALVRIRAARGAQFQGRRIRVALELSPKGRRAVPAFRQLDRVLDANRKNLGERVVATLLV